MPFEGDNVFSNIILKQTGKPKTVKLSIQLKDIFTNQSLPNRL